MNLNSRHAIATFLFGALIFTANLPANDLIDEEVQDELTQCVNDQGCNTCGGKKKKRN